MKVFTAHFIAEEPLIISDGTAEGMKHESLPYVPGSMLLGALVSSWKQSASTDGNPAFEALFLQGSVRWGHAVPVCSDRACVPVPLCWEYVKEYGALPTYGSMSDVSQVRIFNSWRTLDMDEESEPKHVHEQAWKETLKSHAKRKRITSGFVDLESLCAPSTALMRSIHVALDSTQRKAQEGRLFAYEAIAQGTKLCSQILCDDTWDEQVKSFLKQDMKLYVGHSRSAGYGALRLERIEECAPAVTVTVQASEHTLWLTSDYFSKQSWKTPLDALQEELAQHLGSITWNEKKLFCKETRLEGFQGLWKMPRATRHGLGAGSVLTFTCAKAGSLPNVLGAWQQEGYGRFLLDMPALKEVRMEPKPTGKNVCDTSLQPVSQGEWPFLPVWRQRSLVRIAEEQAMACAWSPEIWGNFFRELATCKVSQSQRGNMRRMISTYNYDTWCVTFKDILDKQPGKQWKSSIVRFPRAHNRQGLDVIMGSLLALEKAEEELAICDKNVWNFPKLAGGELSPTEKKDFSAQRHKRFLLEFLKRWEKEVRTNQEGNA